MFVKCLTLQEAIRDKYKLKTYFHGIHYLFFFSSHFILDLETILGILGTRCGNLSKGYQFIAARTFTPGDNFKDKPLPYIFFPKYEVSKHVIGKKKLLLIFVWLFAGIQALMGFS